MAKKRYYLKINNTDPLFKAEVKNPSIYWFPSKEKLVKFIKKRFKGDINYRMGEICSITGYDEDTRYAKLKVSVYYDITIDNVNVATTNACLYKYFKEIYQYTRNHRYYSARLYNKAMESYENYIKNHQNNLPKFKGECEHPLPDDALAVRMVGDRILSVDVAQKPDCSASVTWRKGDEN